jgi:pilus assembly protein CpaB
VPVTPDKVRFVDYPAASIPPGSFRTAAELLPAGKTRIALRPMLVNEPILAAKVTGEGQGASIAALLPDGKRAAAVRINDVSGVAGFVQPNDAVDILITRQGSGSGPAGQSQITDVLLQNIRVIAIDQNANDADGKPVIARTATLEVTPIEAQKLALAQQLGQISLVLRKPGEEQNIPGVETVSLADLRYSLYNNGGVPYRVATPANYRPARTTVRRPAPRRVVRNTTPAAPPRPSTSNVEVVRGTQGNNYEVGEYGS